MIEALDGTPQQRLRLAAEWAEAERRTLLATACRDAETRIAELETALRELLDAFNPEPRVEEPGLIWGRAALALKGNLSGNAYADLRGRIRDLVEHLEHQRDGAKAAAAVYPSDEKRKLGEADAYDDSADHLRELLQSLPE